MFVPHCERPGLTPMQNYGSVYLHFELQPSQQATGVLSTCSILAGRLNSITTNSVPSGLWSAELTAWSEVLLQLVKQFQEFCTTRRYMHYRDNENPPPVPVLCHINPPTSSQTISLRYILISSPSTPRFSKCLFSSNFLTKTLYSALVSPVRATCPAHLILSHLIIRVMFGVGCRVSCVSAGRGI